MIIIDLRCTTASLGYLSVAKTSAWINQFTAYYYDATYPYGFTTYVFLFNFDFFVCG